MPILNCGDLFMNYEKIKSLLQQNKKVHFKLYSMDYEIHQKDDGVIIFSPTYPKDIKKYDNIDKLLTYFTVYNESLMDSDSRIININ